MNYEPTKVNYFMINKLDFSNINREEHLTFLKSEVFDLLIIGGGITGAGIALDAASRGLKVALIEKLDFASGTSSRSTKLVHGGLRYLENYEFRIVYESGRERDIVHRNASHIVIPEKMMLPIIKGGSLNKFMTYIGLTIYDLLAGVNKKERKQMLNKASTLRKEELLNKDIVLGSAIYYEYKTDDARLTIETLKKAHEYGAVSLNYICSKNFIYTNDIISGLVATDIISNNEIKINAKKIINATGPWVDDIRKSENKNSKKRLQLTKGIHISVSKNKFPLKHAIYFDTEDKRMIFVIPRRNSVYIGTTDSFYNDNKENPRASNIDVEYLLKSTNRLFPSLNLTVSDISSTWVGLRPLIKREGKSASELSRKDEIFYSDSGLISIAGGKLTGYRLMASKITDIILKQLGKEENYKFVACSTKTIKLAGGDFNFYPSKHKVIEYAEKLFYEAHQLNIDVKSSDNLFYKYGNNYPKIIDKAYEYRASDKSNNNLWLNAEIWYSINHEMTINLSDFFVRRTGMLHFNYEQISDLINPAADYMAQAFSWTNQEKENQIYNFKKEYEQAKKFID